MPKTPKVPKLSLHKPSGCARVRIQGKDLYLGPYGDPETLQRYSRLLAELAAQQHLWLSNDRSTTEWQRRTWTLP